MTFHCHDALLPPTFMIVTVNDTSKHVYQRWHSSIHYHYK